MRDDDADARKDIGSLLGAQRELESIRDVCEWVTVGTDDDPDTFGVIAHRLRPVIQFLYEERGRRRKKSARR